MNYDHQYFCQLQNTKPKQNPAPALDGLAEREGQSVTRIKVRFIGFRVRLLDPDNFAGSCKDLLDGLRHARLIPEDTASAITFETEQERVQHYEEEKTEIEIVYP